MARGRHHTDVKGLKGIQRTGFIIPGRGDPPAPGVHVEIEPFGTPRPGEGGPMRETGAAAEGAFVEFDLPAETTRTYLGPRNTAVIPTTESFPLAGLNPVFVRVRCWWNLWYFWRKSSS